jgi:hypothetical protein
MATRKPFIAGNWKMNTDLTSATQLAKDLVGALKGLDSSKVDVAVIPPYPFLRDVLKELEGSGVKLGAQNAFYETKGAFTGTSTVNINICIKFCMFDVKGVHACAYVRVPPCTFYRRGLCTDVEKRWL